MQINLKPEQEKFIQEKIASGEYNNADDIISEAFKLLEVRERKIEELRTKITIGTEQIVNGQATDGEIVFERLQKKIDKIANEQNS
jgi:antitoxin ParD1/3/4